MEIIILPLGPLETNCYVVYDEASRVCALVDPGAMPQKILDCLREHELSLQLILLTHAHFDHTGALKKLHECYPQVPIYVSVPDTDDAINMSHGNLVYTNTFSNGDEISLPPMTFRVLATPGHTKGSCCLICDRVIFSGDTLFAGTCGRTDLPGGSEAEILASLSRLAGLEGDYRVLPGHGPETTLERERKTNPYMREASCL